MSQFHFSNPISIDSTRGLFKSGTISCPMVGFGSDKRLHQECTDVILQAAELGYRIIDTATAYQNLGAIGKALSQLHRDEFYIISKVWHDNLQPENVRKDLDATLKHLNSDYLDAYLIHWPNRKTSIEKTLSTMEELRQKQKIKHIGMCNVNVNHLKKALELNIPISWVQVEMNPNFFDKALYELCQQHAIGYQAWRPLDFGRLSQDNMLKNIGMKYNKTPCQIAIRWIVQNGCIPLPGSKNKQHMQENIEVMDFLLNVEDMQTINHLAVPGTRFRLQEDYGLGFTDEFDLTYKECWDQG